MGSTITEKPQSITINGEVYVRLDRLAELTEVPVRTLQTWINKGDLVNFCTAYKDRHGTGYFKLGLPNETDELLPGSNIKYKLPLGGGV